MTEVDDGKEFVLPSNTASTVALLAGLLSCLPGAGLVAIPAGALGIRQAGRTGGVGRASSMLGLALGLINLAWWGALIAGAYQTKFAYEKGQPAIQATGQFVLLVGKGEIARARTFCSDAVTEDQLTDLAEKMGEVGSLQQPDANFGGQVFSSSDIEIQAKLTFDKGVRVLVTHWDVRGETPKLLKFELMDAAATQPVGKGDSPPAK